MRTRRASREWALQALFYVDVSCYNETEDLDLFCKSFPPKKDVTEFSKRLIEGVLEHKHNIDLVIEEYSENWKMHRIACVDRNILRVATFELLYCKDIPHRVSINEAVDVGKSFGTEESGAFINGVLDSIRLAIIEDKIQDT